MLKEISCGALVFRKEKNKIKYLILYKAASDQYKASWDFPKGNVEPGENELEVASREVKEETGIEQLLFIPGFRKTIKFFYRKDGKLVHKQVVFFLAQTKEKNVRLSYEHQGFKWVSFEEAQKLLTHDTSKVILVKANKFLKKCAL